MDSADGGRASQGKGPVPRGEVIAVAEPEDDPLVTAYQREKARLIQATEAVTKEREAQDKTLSKLREEGAAREKALREEIDKLLSKLEERVEELRRVDEEATLVVEGCRNEALNKVREMGKDMKKMAAGAMTSLMKEFQRKYGTGPEAEGFGGSDTDTDTSGVNTPPPRSPSFSPRSPSYSHRFLPPSPRYSPLRFSPMSPIYFPSSPLRRKRKIPRVKNHDVEEEEEGTLQAPPPNPYKSTQRGERSEEDSAAPGPPLKKRRGEKGTSSCLQGGTENESEICPAATSTQEEEEEALEGLDKTLETEATDLITTMQTETGSGSGSGSRSPVKKAGSSSVTFFTVPITAVLDKDTPTPTPAEGDEDEDEEEEMTPVIVKVETLDMDSFEEEEFDDFCPRPQKEEETLEGLERTLKTDPEPEVQTQTMAAEPSSVFAETDDDPTPNVEQGRGQGQGQILRNCAYCSNPVKEGEVLIPCGGCERRGYCSLICKTADWTPQPQPEGNKGTQDIEGKLYGWGQGHAKYCGLSYGEENLDWEVIAPEEKDKTFDTGLFAKRDFEPFEIILIAGVQNPQNGRDWDKVVRRSYVAANAYFLPTSHYPGLVNVMILASDKAIKKGEEILQPRFPIRNYDPGFLTLRDKFPKLPEKTLVCREGTRI